MPLSGRQKAMILLSILGPDASSRILEYLPDKMADLLTAGLSRLPTPSPQVLSEVLQDVKRGMALPGAKERAAIGEETSRPAAAQPRSPGKPADIVSRASGRVLIPALLRERPQTVAFVLRQLPEPKIAEVLAYLPEQRREVEYLLNTVKMTPVSEKIKDRLLEQVASRLS